VSATEWHPARFAARLVMALTLCAVAPGWAAELVRQHRIDALPQPMAGAKVDLAAVARGFEAAGVGAMPVTVGPRLLVFISLAMPEGSLRRLAADAPRAGAVLVLRGLEGGSMIKTAARIRKLGGAGKASIQIDPKAFLRFGIEQVPTMVLARDVAAASPCQERGCAAQEGFVAVAGDVTLAYALDHVVRNAPRFAPEARRLRATLEP
jgi:conjugal transfer pilus assembly protein TrbC